MIPKELDRVRKSLSKQRTWIFRIGYVLLLLFLFHNTWSNWSHASKLAHQAGISFFDIPNYDVSETYSGTHLKALESLCLGMFSLLILVSMAINLIPVIIVRRNNRRMLDYIDKLENETNHRLNPTRPVTQGDGSDGIAWTER